MKKKFIGSFVIFIGGIAIMLSKGEADFGSVLIIGIGALMTLWYAVAVFDPQLYESITRDESIIRGLDSANDKKEQDSAQNSKVAQDISKSKSSHIEKGDDMKYHPKTLDELEALVSDERIYLGDIDTSIITDMSFLFFASERKDFSGIESWNVSNVTDMSNMFCDAIYFNQPLNAWNVSSVTDMSNMFCGAKSFNQPLNSWDVSNVKEMYSMFMDAKRFNQSLENWDLCSVTNIDRIFNGAESLSLQNKRRFEKLLS